MEQHKSSFTLHDHGFVSVLLSLTFPILTMFWGFMIFGIVGGLAGEQFMSIARNVALLPVLFPPLWCAVGIFRSVRHLETDKDARFCLIMSILGIVLYAAVFLALEWIGGRVQV